ncbi:MAG: hypothetical protein OEZ68_04985 [Gammaproteobacteria bacterium]|nr:hypothetical protein [Gammaproteobacteria bacterium]MDH5800143.1 hypothetical protein [Gammaproteobacteria bacterium]
MKKITVSLMMAGSLLITGCSDNKAYETSICALADISGTYAKEKKSMVKIIKAGLLPKMVPGDGIFLVAIDSNSYTQKNLVTKMTLDYRPTEVQKQKLAFSEKLEKFAKDTMRSKHTDISGAMMLCSDYLKDTKSGTQLIFIFSDMKEELPSGVRRKFKDNEFSGIHIAAMNVIKLNKDSADPERYRSRMEKWKKKLDDAGAKSWSNIIDANKLSDYIDSIKS